MPPNIWGYTSNIFFYQLQKENQMSNLTVQTNLFEYGYLHGSGGFPDPRFPSEDEYMRGFQEGRKDLFNQYPKMYETLSDEELKDKIKKEGLTHYLWKEVYKRTSPFPYSEEKAKSREFFKEILNT
jgi:hypothetical protein